MSKKKEETRKKIEIKRPKRKVAKFRIVGESNSMLRVHRLGKKAKEELDNTKEGKKARKRKPRDYKEEFLDSLHYITADCREAPMPEKITSKTRFGFPSGGFKKAMISAARQFENVTMAELKGVFFVENDFVEIKGKPKMDGFWRRIGGKGPGTGTPDWGIRAKFEKWEATVIIRYVEDWITLESLANLLDAAGFAVGCGEDRPEKNGGSSGMWKVA